MWHLFFLDISVNIISLPTNLKILATNKNSGGLRRLGAMFTSKIATGTSPSTALKIRAVLLSRFCGENEHSPLTPQRPPASALVQGRRAAS